VSFGILLMTGLLDDLLPHAVSINSLGHITLTHYRDSARTACQANRILSDHTVGLVLSFLF